MACRRRSVTSSTRARPASVVLMSTSRRLPGLGDRSTHPPATIRSIDRLNVEEFAPIRSARLPIRRGPALVRTTSTRKCGSVTNSSAGETDRATTPRSARDAVRIVSVVCALSPGCSFTAPCLAKYGTQIECTLATVARLHLTRASQGGPSSIGLHPTRCLECGYFPPTTRNVGVESVRKCGTTERSPSTDSRSSNSNWIRVRTSVSPAIERNETEEQGRRGRDERIDGK